MKIAKIHNSFRRVQSEVQEAQLLLR